MSLPDATPLKLILMRHAKSDWSDGSLSDHDRPLNERGRRAAPRMAVWLKSVNCVPDAILSSTAARTRETVKFLSGVLGEINVSWDESLYLSSPDTILNTIRSQGNDARCLMVVAHNPGMTHLSSVLAGESISMPTAAAVVFQTSISHWDELPRNNAANDFELIEFMRPKALDQP